MNMQLKFGRSIIERLPAYNFLPDTELDDIVEYLASYKTKKAEAV